MKTTRRTDNHQRLPEKPKNEKKRPPDAIGLDLGFGHCARLNSEYDPAMA